jgi:hypothetical protein
MEDECSTIYGSNLLIQRGFSVFMNEVTNRTKYGLTERVRHRTCEPFLLSVYLAQLSRSERVLERNSCFKEAKNIVGTQKQNKFDHSTGERLHQSTAPAYELFGEVVCQSSYGSTVLWHGTNKTAGTSCTTLASVYI